MANDFDPQSAIVMLAEKNRRNSRFTNDRAVTLFQLQAWIISNDPELRRNAARLLGLCLLENIEMGIIKESGTLYLPGARTLFDNNEYRAVYKNVIGRYGGLTRLMNSPSRIEFDRLARKEAPGIETTCRLIDYRFRYLDHGGNKKSMANISHSQYFVLNTRPAMSWKTLSKRWSAHRKTAVFLYVLYRFAPELVLLPFAEKAFLRKLQSQSQDCGLLRDYFGRVKYVAEMLGEHQYDRQNIIPSSLRALRPPTTPLSAGELSRMASYNDEYMNMRL